jgi:3-deoxy-D-manno-octulosonate 8-phosphate phosphatase (KDO 8-P phosphatase)
MHHILEKARNIRAIIFDVDGVLTDGSLYLTDRGEEIKAFNSHDGHGIKMLKATGVGIAILTGRQSTCVDLKAKDWGVTLVYQGAKKKLPAFEALLEELDLDSTACAYMGDDLIALPSYSIRSLQPSTYSSIPSRFWRKLARLPKAVAY